MKLSDELWLIEFYAPWCGHCQQLAPSWKKAAEVLKGVVKVGAVDMDKNAHLGSPYDVKGFPTLKIFGSDKGSPVDFKAGRDASSIVKEALKQLNDMVQKRLGEGANQNSKKSDESQDSSGSAVVELTDENFNQIFSSDLMWLVEFFAPWCGHCQRLKPEWESAAKELRGKVKLAAVDATVNKKYASQYNIRGFPTIKVFKAGVKNEDAEDYNGGRTADEIVQWALDRYTDSLPPPDTVELVDTETLNNSCDSHQICIVSFLPVLLDCQSECRNKYLSILKTMAAKFARNNWGWLWAEATQQIDLENAFGIGGFGYPAMAAMNVRKKIFSILKGSFGDDGINEFLLGLSYGRGSTAPLPNSIVPKVVTVSPWNGMDAKASEEEEIDLEDLGLKLDL